MQKVKNFKMPVKWLPLICVLYLLPVYGQTNKIDSLKNQLKKVNKDTTIINTLNALAWELKNINPDSSIILSSQALSLAQKVNYEIGIGKANHELGWFNILKGQYDVALEHFFKALILWDSMIKNARGNEKSSFLNKKSSTLGNIGVVYMQRSEYDKAIEYHYKSLSIFETLGDKSKMASTYGNIGNVYYAQSNYPKAIECLTKAQKIFEEMGNKDGVAIQYVNLGNIYTDQSDFSRAIDAYSNAQKVFKELNNKNSEAVTVGNIANVYLKQSDYPKALDYYFKALKITEELGNKQSQAINLGNIGTLYEEQGNYEKALSYYRSALKISEEIGDKDKISSSLGNIGMIYLDQSNVARQDSVSERFFKSAAEYFFKALKMTEELGDKTGMARNLANIGLLYMNHASSLKDIKSQYELLDKAAEFNFNALKIAEQVGDKNGVAADLGNIGSIYARKKEYAKAGEYIQRSLQVSYEVGALRLTRNQEKTAAEIDSILGNYKGAFAHYKKYIAARDSINSMENIKKQTRREMQYDFDKKETQARLDQARKDVIAEEESKKQKMIRNLFICGFLIAVFLSLFIFRSYQNKKKANIVITRQKQEVEQAKLIIDHQKHLVEEKHKEITDSINYAERIQKSFLATKSLLDENLKDYFVLFQPKDVVSGDFYWASKLANGRFALVTADSTGHGVPGAIMSLLNITSLEKAIETNTEPSTILNATRKIIIERLKKDGSAEGGKDGMDSSLISFDFTGSKLTYAAANNPVWIVRGREMLEFAPDKMPVGKHDKDSVSFTQHEIELKKGDVVYAITDGMPDQFGGAKGKKYMYKQLKELLVSVSHLSMEDQKAAISDSFLAWKGNLEQVDDVTIIGVRV
jgi:tetratricopeptide (TPR) repeat protein